LNLNRYKIVIPARGGSKRFPGKNTVNFIDKPLISHSIEYALNFFPSNSIWVNTDDDEISSIAIKSGINLTKRPIELATDTASTVDVLKYQCKEFEKMSIEYDTIILLQATNPIRPQNLIENTIFEFEKSKRKSLASFTILNKKIGNIVNNFFTPTNYAPGQRMQDLKPDYFENGLIYITSRNSILEGCIITKDVYPYIYNGIESYVDIDEPVDLIFAEFIYNKIKNTL
jgi:CMP-N-acetylneuraminic acid synthetase